MNYSCWNFFNMIIYFINNNYNKKKIIKINKFEFD